MSNKVEPAKSATDGGGDAIDETAIVDGNSKEVMA